MTSKIRKALDKVQRFLDANRKKQRKKRLAIIEKTKLLRNRMKAIRRRLDSDIDSEKRSQLKAELALIKSKRQKALAVLKELRKDCR